MDNFDWILGLALVELTAALLVLVWLFRRTLRLEALLSAPPPEDPGPGLRAALADLADRVGELGAPLERLAGLEGLEQRLPDLSAVEARLTAVDEKLAGLDRLASMEETLLDLAALARREPPEIDLAAKVQPMLTEAVENLDARLRNFTASLRKEREETRAQLLGRVLGERGFTEIVVVGATKTPEGLARVVVEAKRDGMSFKGPVLIDEGRVVEQTLRPSYPMFP